MKDPVMTVCLCIMMNHPFPAIIPLLREIYSERFKKVLFLVPFERSPDPDVVTVYRGSYCHSGYITDALPLLTQVDCDHFIFMHDDVLLNYCVNERNFYETFPLGDRDGFIPDFALLHTGIGDWIFQFGHIARVLYPKSILFGSGVERENLVKYLAPLNIRSKLAGLGLGPSDTVRLSKQYLGDIVSKPARLLLDGLSFSGRHQPTQERIDHESQLLIESFVALLEEDAGAETINIGSPFLLSGHYTDFYILPKVVLADFAHYIGICSAANLFVEISTPTVMFGLCENVRRAADLGLDFIGFEHRLETERFQDRNFIAIHPYKLSPLLKDAERREAMINECRQSTRMQPGNS